MFLKRQGYDLVDSKGGGGGGGGNPEEAGVGSGRWVRVFLKRQGRTW